MADLNDLSILNLKIMVVLNSICYGLIYPFLSTYIIQIGGTYFHVGLMGFGNYIASTFSPEIIYYLMQLNGKKFALFVVLNISLISHLLLALTSNYWFTIIIRILFNCINQSQYICSCLFDERIPDVPIEKHRMDSICNILVGIGYVIGPILGGYIFEIGFGYVTTLAAIFTLINIILLMRIPNNKRNYKIPNKIIEISLAKVHGTIDNFRQFDYQINWDILLTKYLLSSSVTVFFSKFSQLMKVNYQSSNVAVGYLTAYINILIFFTTSFATVLKIQTVSKFGKSSNEISAFILAISLILTCYAPNYCLFMIFLIPAVYFKTFLNNLSPDLFIERKINLIYSIDLIAGLTTPLIFGIARDQIGVNAVIIFSCLPVCLYWLITRFYTRNLIIPRDLNKKTN